MASGSLLRLPQSLQLYSHNIDARSYASDRARHRRLTEGHPPVHTFTLSGFWVSKPEDYSQASPSTLHKTITRSLLERLEAPTLADVFSQSPLLPKLRSLQPAAQSHFDADNVFVDVVKSRWDRTSGDGSSYATERLRAVVL
ncbi:hypothetical protein V5O48_013395, partial [Marasmius crinis-equi]